MLAIIWGTEISTHTPLAGRDGMTAVPFPASTSFLLTRPSRDVTAFLVSVVVQVIISTHTPLAGRDLKENHFDTLGNISTHTPLA